MILLNAQTVRIPWSTQKPTRSIRATSRKVTLKKEIHPGATPFSRANRFRVVPRKYRCLCNLHQQGKLSSAGVAFISRGNLHQQGQPSSAGAAFISRGSLHQQGQPPSAGATFINRGNLHQQGETTANA